MENHSVIFIILYILIASTLINVLVLGNKKFAENPKVKKFLKVSLIAGIVVFVLTLLSFLYLR